MYQFYEEYACVIFGCASNLLPFFSARARQEFKDILQLITAVKTEKVTEKLVTQLY